MSVADTYPVEMGERGRLVLPAQVRRELDLSPGERLLLRVEPDGGLRLVSARAQAERMRGMLSDVGSGRSLSDELIAERRAEAEREGSEW